MEPCLMATTLMWPPLYYGHFILVRTNAQSVSFLFKEPLVTMLIQPNFCDQINGVPLYKEF